MRRNIRFLVCAVLGALCVVGSSFAARGLLAVRERRLLSEYGVMEVRTPASSWEEEQKEDQRAERRSLKTQQVESALRAWQESRGEILHEPMAGQLSMEEAFEAGRSWIRSMAAKECFPSGLLDEQGRLAEEESLTAVLSMAAEEDEKGAEPWRSYWKVTFANSHVRIALSVNALTGYAWEAELILYEEKKDLSEAFFRESLTKFLELSGVENPVSGYARRKNGAVCYLTDTSIYALLEWEREETIYVWSKDGGVRKERPGMRISYRLGTI